MNTEKFLVVANKKGKKFTQRKKPDYWYKDQVERAKLAKQAQLDNPRGKSEHTKQVLRLHDTGLTVLEICEKTGRKYEATCKIINTYRDSINREGPLERDEKTGHFKPKEQEHINHDN